MKRFCFCAGLLLAAAYAVLAQDDLGAQLLGFKRVYVDKLTGGETAAQMRDLIIASLQGAKLFVVTENPERADAILRGAAEDLVYTDTFQSSESADLRGSVGTGSRSTRAASGLTRLSVGANDRESTDIRERKHEAMATVRLVNKDGDVIWSTTQESNGAKFRGASADVADKISRALSAEYERLRKVK
jgi:hypothetical protein